MNKAVDNLFDYIDPIQGTMNKDYAAFVIQRAYRKHLIRKYFNHLKYCMPMSSTQASTQTTKEKSKGWFY